MGETEKHTTGWARVRKWLLIIVGVLLILLAAARWLLQSDQLLNYLRGMAETQVSEQLNGSLSISRIDGDLLRGIRITGIELLDQEGEQLAAVDSLMANYSVLNLIREPYELNELTIYGLAAHGVQDTTGAWNFERLVPPSDEPYVEEETEMPFWRVHELRLHDSSLSVVSPSLPDERVLIDQLELHGGIGYEADEWSASVMDLAFFVREARLPQPIEIGGTARYEDERITLERLLVDTGRTYILSRAEADDEGGQIGGEADLGVLSWQDIRAYADLPLEQDLEGSLDFGGSLTDFRVGLNLSAGGLENLSLEGRFRLQDQPSLQQFNLQIDQLNGPLLTGDASAPVVNSLEFSGAGNVIFDQLEESRFTGTLAMSGGRLREYALESVNIEAEWLEEEADLHIFMVHSGQTVEGNISVREIFGDQPVWQIGFTGDDVNLAEWLNEPEMESRLTFSLNAQGSGFELSGETFAVGGSLTDSRWGDQRLDSANLEGELTATQFSGFIEGETGGSRVGADLHIDNWQTEPVYRFTVQLDSFNAANLQGLEEFPTRLDAVIEGEGARFDLENLELTASMRFDPGMINHEPLENLEATLEIRDQAAIVTGGVLASPVADVTFSFRQHLFDFRDPENTLELDGRLKDITFLAGLLDVETVEAEGSFRGRLYRQSEGELQFEGDVDFENLAYDTLFTIDAVEGVITALLLEEPRIGMDLDIRGPVVQGFALQSARLQGEAVIRDTLTVGDLLLELDDEENVFRYTGQFQYREDDLFIRTTDMLFRTPERDLTLQQPFDLTFSNQVLQMEAMQIQSPGEEAWLELAIPWLDENRQEVEMNARLLNIGAVQRIFLDESLVDAMLSGSLQVSRVDEEIESRIELQFDDIRYRNAVMDSLRIDVSIQDRRLASAILAWHEENELLVAEGNIPFILADPATIGDEFFEQPVSGQIRVPPTTVAFWTAFLDEGTELDALGIISFDSAIEGTAGHPEFSGLFELTAGSLSGIAVDSLGIALDYQHEASSLRFDGEVHSLGSLVADFEGSLPFYLDMREFQVDLPQDDDEIFAAGRMDNFDLAILNEFLDRDLMRGLAGRLDGSFEVNGTVATPEPNGTLTLRNGGLRIVPVGVNLGDIRFDVAMSPDRVDLTGFLMRSGPGGLTANGSIALTDLTPGDLQMSVNANQFRVANTADMNVIINLNSTLAGTVDNPTLTGTLSFLSGYVNLQNFGEQAVEDVRLEDEDEPEPFAFYDMLTAEMTVNFNRQFFIRNRQYLDMEVELAGTIDLVKGAGEEPQMFGSIEGVRGYARPLGRNFEIEDAVVTFFGPVENPELDIRTFYQPPQADEVVTLWYIIEGTVEDPEFRFESDPFLELQDIISYTLFGRPFYALESWQQALSGDGQSASAADMALDLLLDRFELVAAQQLGIDVVQIDTDRTAAGSTTTIKTGWYLNNRTFFAVLNEISGRSPKTLFLLEYMIRRNLELVVTQGDDSREGIDLRWNFDY